MASATSQTHDNNFAGRSISSNRGLTRGKGARRIAVANYARGSSSSANKRSIHELMSNQHRSIANLAGKSVRRCCQPSLNDKRDSLGMDELTLHALCSEVAAKMGGGGGETTMHTVSTTSISVGGTSLNSFGEASFILEKEEEEGLYEEFDISLIDTNLQRAELERFEQQKQASSDPIAEQDENINEVGNDNNLIEVSPGINLPLRGSTETWKAILAGRITVTRCYGCQEDLTCVEDAALVICGDCFIFSPVDQSIAGSFWQEERAALSFGNNNISGDTVGMGIKSDEMREWIDAQQETSS